MASKEIGLEKAPYNRKKLMCNNFQPFKGE